MVDIRSQPWGAVLGSASCPQRRGKSGKDLDMDHAALQALLASLSGGGQMSTHTIIWDPVN
ncbi:hypothetical protein GCM10008112_37910 [Flexivirga endophytica]|nr:hypothetical protein GCM10008112_37910 [Flexivirga endophytica]